MTWLRTYSPSSLSSKGEISPKLISKIRRTKKKFPNLILIHNALCFFPIVGRARNQSCLIDFFRYRLLGDFNFYVIGYLNNNSIIFDTSDLTKDTTNCFNIITFFQGVDLSSGAVSVSFFVVQSAKSRKQQK